MVTFPDNNVLHTQFMYLWKEDTLGFLFHKQIHEISPGAIQKSNGLKVTCLMSLYFKFEEDTMKNEIPEIIFVIIFPDTPPPFNENCH